MTALPITLETPAAAPGLVGVPAKSAAGPTPKVIGLDLSLTSTGVAWPGGTTRIKTGKLRDHERLAHICAEIEQHARPADLVVVEGPSFGSQGSAYHQLAGLWWLVTHELWRMRMAVAVAPPAAVKTYATGKGNAGKDEVLVQVVRRFPDVQILGNDEADAYILCALGCDHLGVPLVDMPATHRKALAKCEWPDLDLSGVSDVAA